MLASEVAVAVPSSQECASMTSMPRLRSSLASARTLRAAAPAFAVSPLSTIRAWRNGRFAAVCMMSSFLDLGMR